MKIDFIREGLNDYAEQQEEAARQQAANEAYNAEILRDIAIAQARLRLRGAEIFDLVVLSIYEPIDSVLFEAACEELEALNRHDDPWDRYYDDYGDEDYDEY